MAAKQKKERYSIMSEPLKLENERMVLVTNNPAGQMFSLFDKKNQQELLYQADQGWSGRNPSLFPMIGQTWKDGTYQWNGKTYQMKNHGLIRYENLDGKIDGDSIVYTFDSNEETRSRYPFDFHFELRYTLLENGVKVSYAITNTSDEMMPFSFGLHPAFKTAREGESFEDFSVRFEPAREAEQIVFFADKSPIKREPVMLDEWKCNYKDLENYSTLVYVKIAADSATIVYKDTPRLKMGFEGYPSVALWNPGEGNTFICIEPWFGHTDFEKVEVPFDKREGTMNLLPAETFNASYTVETLE